MRLGVGWALLVLPACATPVAAPAPASVATAGDETPHVAAPRDTFPAPSPSHAPRAFVPPQSRSDRATPSSAPELADAEAAWALLVAMPLGLSVPPANLQSGIDLAVLRIQRAARRAREVVEASEPAATRGAIPVRVAALTFEADAYDFLAAHAASAPFLPPSGTSWSTVQLAQLLTAVTEALQSATAPLYCLAVARYQDVLALDPENARARAQLTAYGDASVRSCTP